MAQIRKEMLQMKDKRVILSIGIFMLISIMTLVFTSNSNQTEELTEIQKLFNELSLKHFGEFGSDKYLIKGNYISKIYPNTKVKDFIKDLHDDVVIYDGEKQVTDGIVKTGMVLEFYDLRYVLLVTGDLNNDGKYNQVDLNRIIRSIGKEDITEAEIILSDLNNDGSVTEDDAELGAEILVGSKKLEIVKPEAVVIPQNSLTGASLANNWYSSDVTLTLSAYSAGYEYEYYGSKKFERVKLSSSTIISFSEGAYLVRVFYYAADGNTRMLTHLIGVDYSRNKCLELGVDTLSECMLVNDDAKYESVEDAKSSIKKKTTDLTNIATTDEGLLSIKDKDGDAFYYRGAVRDNFVEFAGYVWRIVRRNGDGSVRLVYNGTSTSSTGTNTQIGTSMYGSSFDYKNIGYKSNADLNFVEIDGIHEFSFNIYTSYTFADSYTCDETTEKCTLSGNKITGKYSDIYDTVLNGDTASGGKPYKYFKPNSSSYASFVLEIDTPVVVNGVTSSALVNVKYFGYLEQNSPNTTSSTLKNTIDTWYINNLMKKSDEGIQWSEYLADNYFCDEKSWSSEFASGGYTVTFKAYERINNFKPSFVCESDKDMYTVKNGELSYPIGLLTADEVMFAGGNSTSNTSYWLYTGSSYWTMTTNSLDLSAPLWQYNVAGDGKLETNAVSYSGNGIRPVINLSKDVLFAGGSGTVGDPYKVALNK